MTEPTDLFGHRDGGDQLSLFGLHEGRPQQAPTSFAPDPEAVRKRLKALLDTARNSQAMPWTDAKARMWQTVFPQMAAWLPEEEAAQLCVDFNRELGRLKTAA